MEEDVIAGFLERLKIKRNHGFLSADCNFLYFVLSLNKKEL